MYRAHLSASSSVLIAFLSPCSPFPSATRASERSRAPTLEIDPRGAGSDAKISQRTKEANKKQEETITRQGKRHNSCVLIGREGRLPRHPTSARSCDRSRRKGIPPRDFFFVTRAIILRRLFFSSITLAIRARNVLVPRSRSRSEMKPISVRSGSSAEPLPRPMLPLQPPLGLSVPLSINHSADGG